MRDPHAELEPGLERPGTVREWIALGVATIVIFPLVLAAASARDVWLWWRRRR